MTMIMLKNVRCSFPQLWKDGISDSGKNFGKGVHLLLSKTENAAELKAVSGAMASVAKGNQQISAALKKAGGDMTKALKGKCLRGPGEESWQEIYPDDNMLLKCGCKKTPLVLHKNATKATEVDDQIYSGCMVNAKVDIWAQANNWGRRINAKLIAIQFAGDNEPFDGSYVSEETALEGFESLQSDDTGLFDGVFSETESSSNDSRYDFL